MGLYSLITGRRGPSGFGSATSAEEVTQRIDATHLTAIITGGAGGIGMETARVMAKRGVHAVIGARNIGAAENAKAEILRQNTNARVTLLHLDLSSVKSIRAFVRDFHALHLPLNLLINNAGVMFCPYQLSEDEIELQFATNHIGHFLLTNLLLDTMKTTAKTSGVEGRILNLSSIAHIYTYKEGIKFDSINDICCYSDKRAYGQSKLANILHANELSRQLQEEGVNITVNSVHPGLILTNLFQHTALLMSKFSLCFPRIISFKFSLLFALIPIFTGFLKFFSFYLWKNIPQGAATTCYVALHPTLKGVTGKYFADCNEVTPSKLARDETLARKLWDFSVKLINSVSKKNYLGFEDTI
ncbi:short-chain dehydrogenase TIC 32 B, chloroplastic isoform X1 [Brassica rapa]|uniref:short-chain dehydrogenase TIC 32 B, chloroplastic isoform X1 n=1 Tax=Brassica campestris TaxID=3711 RepID=UPI000872041D|nr:short-chain dehydrogenase TIC 32 B, chloroplastic isoform X1 [Brassica rapa]XP_022566046.2 short-chain dehydrogenase TIC 32 B, chloroplastic-like isoform X1 [Brassica napus]